MPLLRTLGLACAVLAAWPAQALPVRTRAPHRTDPARRAAALEALVGYHPAAAEAHRLAIASVEARRWAQLLPGSGAAATGQAWVNLGPTDADLEWNEGPIDGVDSGRITQIVADPRDGNVVYLSTAGGGVWKCYDFLSAYPNPSWIPIGDQLDNLAVGGLALDPQNPDILYIAVGDPFDGHGNGVYKSVDGGGTWQGPIALDDATYGPATGARNVRVDPLDSGHILVATDAGLYESHDAGDHFTRVALTLGGQASTQEIWSITFAGAQGGKSTFVVSGFGYDSTATNSIGALWRTTDSGATWTELQSLPRANTDFYRTAVAAGAPKGAQTTLYAMVATGNAATGTGGTGFWRSDDAGATWHDAVGTLSNPASDNYCVDTNIAHEQAWYDLAIAVDPTDDAHVAAGGSLCAIRTTSGKAAQPTWENMAHWFPSAGGDVGGQPLPYVHADWHAMIAVVLNGQLYVLAGTDGGLFSSTNVLNPAAVPGGTGAGKVAWAGHNKGLVTHLGYAVASGDPASNNPGVVFIGNQDNGTRFRVPGKPTTFNMVVGGDGIGCAVNAGTAGTWYWASVVTDGFGGAYNYCRPDQADCSVGTSWQSSDPPVPSSEIADFNLHYSPVQTDPTGAAFLTNTNSAIWKSDANANWTKLSPDYTSDGVRNVFASQTVASLYGAALGNGHFAVTGDETTWTTSAQLGVGADLLSHATSLAFPPTTPSGKQPGDVYLAASAAYTTDAFALVPDSVGHLFKTEDRGQSWLPFHGNGSGADLPNLPVFVVRYDPGDASGNTLYAGTDLGVYRSTDGGNTWARFGYNLPLVRVTDLFVARNSSLVRIATYGRGVWELYPEAAAPRGVGGDGDFDRNLLLDYVDLAALGSRLGTTPATAGWPTYSGSLDLSADGATPAVNALDDNDLTLMLSRFGGHP